MAAASLYFSVPLILSLFATHLFSINAVRNRFTAPNFNFPVFPKGWAQRFYHERSGYFQGDIRVSRLVPDLKAGSNSPRWTNGVIPYTFHSKIGTSGRKAIRMAMQDIESKTCIRFQPRRTRKPEKDYVYITGRSQGCFSYVGRDGGGQQLNLGPGCWHKTTIVHELVHAVGFWHEQSRQDRDKAVNIQWRNIPRSFWSEFSKRSHLNDFGTPYDYRSVMHYSYNAFAKNRNKPTITTKQDFPLRLLGAGDEQGGLTEIDAKQINLMYSCTSVNNSTNTKNRWG